jgi:predicted dehydrogenase
LPSRIEPSADVASDASIGDGTVIWHLAHVRERAVLGHHCVVGRGAYIGAVGIWLAQAGMPALVEKPLAPDLTAAARLVDAFEMRGLIGAVGHIERYNAALQSLRRRLEAGELGEVYQVATRRQSPFPARIADVGLVKDLATHDIDLTAWVTGQSFWTVSARTAFRSGRRHEDLVAVVGQLADGTVTNHLVNWLSPLKERVTIVTGDKGTFVADTLTADLIFFANGQVSTAWTGLAQFRGVSEGDMVRYAIAKPEPLRVEHEQFRDAMLGLDADIVTMRQGLPTVAVADATIESARTGTTQTLGLSEHGPIAGVGLAVDPTLAIRTRSGDDGEVGAAVGRVIPM